MLTKGKLVLEEDWLISWPGMTLSEFCEIQGNQFELVRGHPDSYATYNVSRKIGGVSATVSVLIDHGIVSAVSFFLLGKDDEVIPYDSPENIRSEIARYTSWMHEVVDVSCPIYAKWGEVRVIDDSRAGFVYSRVKYAN